MAGVHPVAATWRTHPLLVAVLVALSVAGCGSRASEGQAETEDGQAVADQGPLTAAREFLGAAIAVDFEAQNGLRCPSYRIAEEDRDLWTEQARQLAEHQSVRLGESSIVDNNRDEAGSRRVVEATLYDRESGSTRRTELEVDTTEDCVAAIVSGYARPFDRAATAAVGQCAGAGVVGFEPQAPGPGWSSFDDLGTTETAMATIRSFESRYAESGGARIEVHPGWTGADGTRTTGVDLLESWWDQAVTSLAGAPEPDGDWTSLRLFGFDWLATQVNWEAAPLTTSARAFSDGIYVIWVSGVDPSEQQAAVEELQRQVEAYCGIQS